MSHSDFGRFFIPFHWCPIMFRLLPAKAFLPQICSRDTSQAGPLGTSLQCSPERTLSVVRPPAPSAGEPPDLTLPYSSSHPFCTPFSPSAPQMQRASSQHAPEESLATVRPPRPFAGEPVQFSQLSVFQYVPINRAVHLRKLRCGQCAPDILLRPLSPQPPFAGEPEQSLQPSVFQYVPVNRAVHLRKAFDR